MARLSLSLLNSFQAMLDEKPVRGFDSDKVRALLAYLAVESDRAHSRDSLADLLWPEFAPAAARTNLRNALANLRALLRDRDQRPPFLQITTEAIGLNRASDCQADVLDFEALLAGARSTERLEQATALYPGDFLAGFALKDSAPFDDWAMLTRERLRREFLDALRQLAARHQEQGEQKLALADARRWAEADPWDEGGQRELMRLLALTGQRSAALAQYERCKQALSEELGVEPEEETSRLYEQIRDGALGRPPAAQRPRNLPPALTPLVGREQEISALRARLEASSCRLLTILGPGGSGKTRLALELAHRLDGAPREVVFAPLSGVQGEENLVPAIAQALGFSFYAAPTSPRQQLLDYLREKQTLLILDGLEEHLPTGASLLSEILGASPRLKLLITSRARVGLQQEELFPLGGLALTPSEALTPSPSPKGGGEPLPLPLGEGRVRAEGAELFLQGARCVRPDYAPTADDDQAIGRICRLVEGMPLAILLASAWMELLSPSEIAAQIEQQSLDFLQADWPDAPERQRSMRAVLDHSWRLLGEREQGMLAALALFQGSFTAEAAQAVAGAGLRDLLRLVDRSLLQRAAEGRYVLHDLSRQYAAEKLAAPGAETAARDRHAAYYARTLEGWRADMYSSRQAAFVRAMTREGANILAAWDWALRRARLDWVDQMQDSLTRWHVFQFRYPEADALLSQGLAAVEQAPPSAQRAKTLAGLLSAEAMVKNFLGHSPAARAHLERCFHLLDEAEQAGEDVRFERMKSLRRMGYVAGSPAEQLFFQERALEAARALGNRAEEAQALMATGQALWHEGQRQRGRQLQESAAAMFRELGHYSNLIKVLDSLTNIAFQDGRRDDMAKVVSELQTVVQTTEDAQTRAYALGQLAAVQSALGRSTEALAAMEQGIAICEEQGNRYQLLNLMGQVSHTLMVSGRYAESRERDLRLLPLAQRYDHRGAQYNALFHLLWAAILEGSLAEVEEWWKKYIEYCDRLTGRGAYVAVMSGWAACRLGRLGEARRYLGEAMHHPFVSSSPIRLGMDVIPCLALTWAKEGQVERAVELYALCQKSLEGGSPVAYAKDMFFRPLAKAAASLPPEVREAAEARGRARDWEATVKEILAELEQS